MAIFSWIHALKQTIGLESHPHVDRWATALRARPAVDRAIAVLKESRGATSKLTDEVRSVLFGARQMAAK